MKAVKFSKWKLVGAIATSLFLGMPSFEAEAFAFRLTAPSDALVVYSCDYLARKFSPSPQERSVVSLVNPQKPSPQ